MRKVVKKLINPDGSMQVTYSDNSTELILAPFDIVGETPGGIRASPAEPLGIQDRLGGTETGTPHNRRPQSTNRRDVDPQSLLRSDQRQAVVRQQQPLQQSRTNEPLVDELRAIGEEHRATFRTAQTPEARLARRQAQHQNRESTPRLFDLGRLGQVRSTRTGPASRPTFIGGGIRTEGLRSRQSPRRPVGVLQAFAQGVSSALQNENNRAVINQGLPELRDVAVRSMIFPGNMAFYAGVGLGVGEAAYENFMLPVRLIPTVVSITEFITDLNDQRLAAAMRQAGEALVQEKINDLVQIAIEDDELTQSRLFGQLLAPLFIEAILWLLTGGQATVRGVSNRIRRMAQNMGEEIGPHVSENRSLQNRLDDLGDAFEQEQIINRSRPAQTDSPDSSSSGSALLDEIIEHTEHVNRQRRLDEAIDQAEQQRPGQHPQQGENRRRTDENDGVSPQGRFSPTDPFDFLQRFFGRRTWREKLRGPNARQRLVDMLSDARRNVLSSRRDHRANSNYVELVIDREVLQRQDVHYLDVIARRERMVTPDRVAMTGRGLRRIESTSAVPSRQDYHSFVDRVFDAMVRKVRSRQLTVPLTSSEGVNVPPLGTVYIGTPRRSGLSLREMRRGTREAFNRFIRRYGRNTLNHGIESIEVYAMQGFLDEVQVDRLGRFTSEQ